MAAWQGRTITNTRLSGRNIPNLHTVPNGRHLFVSMEFSGAREKLGRTGKTAGGRFGKMLDQLLVIDTRVPEHERKREQVCHEIRSGITGPVDK